MHHVTIYAMQRVVSFVQMYWVIALLAVLGTAGVVYVAQTRNTSDAVFVVQKDQFLQQVSVSGKVIADQEVDLGFSQGGRVSKVYVKEGVLVSKGALIAEIENGDVYASLLQKQAALQREQARLDSSVKGTRPEEIAVAESAVASAEAALVSANQSVVDAILSAYSTSDGAVRASVDQFFSNPRSQNPQINFQTGNTSAESAVESGRVDVEALLIEWQSKNASVSSAVLVRAAEAQVSLTRVSDFLGSVSGALAVSIPSSTVTQTVLDGYKTSIATARASVNTSASTLTTAIKAQSAAAAALATSEKDLALKKAGTTPEDIRAQEANVKAAEADVVSAQAQLEKTQIRAPFTGTVTRLDARVGATASPGVSQISLIGSGAFQIEGYVPELNVALVRVGNAARVTFDSYLGTIFDATVASVDLGETVKDGVSTYRTVLTFNQNDDRIRSGMTANVVIVTDSREGVISVPQGLIMSRVDGSRFVTVRTGEVDSERTVTVGAVSSLGNIEITSGLVEGEQIPLTPGQ